MAPSTSLASKLLAVGAAAVMLTTAGTAGAASASNSQRPIGRPMGGLAIRSFSVSPALMYETDNLSANTACHSTGDASSPSDLTYAKLAATITDPFPITSVDVAFSFPGNSGSGPMELDYGSTTQWSTDIGGWDYTNFTITGVETVTYTLTVTDTHGHVAQATVTNSVQECDATTG